MKQKQYSNSLEFTTRDRQETFHVKHLMHSVANCTERLARHSISHGAK